MGERKHERRIPTKDEEDAFRGGVDAAMRRASIKASRGGIETTGLVPTWRDVKIVNDTEV